ncbi:hypothetical protein AAFA21_19535 (plasmid) [Acinetobacter baumannii]|jgi:hypothetical protein|nr:MULTISPECIES: hypothetical protein [Acinetobacter calcoaceticus/baumannii complex]WPQ01549.1 hypothetical protein SOI75_20020 [Acinetobacter pittii]CAA6834992.1 Uncharacterised protein [Acinetobacter baumannii ATCC 17978]CAH1090755.1 Uncharacterised protein [Acinetobacter phage MD-2021a]MCA4252403.1 hypothetical protein [Acinetobacter baumannii]MCA4397893.1 hypothetical protein [Acinetobacter baumannii]
MKKSMSKADFERIRAHDFVVLKGVNNKLIVGQVSVDKSCIFLSLTNNELSRLAMIPELILENLGSIVELMKKYKEVFSRLNDVIEKSNLPELNEYKNDSLFKIKALYALRELLDSAEVNEDVTTDTLEIAVKKALEECVYIQDVQFTLSYYILNRPKQNTQMM